MEPNMGLMHIFTLMCVLIMSVHQLLKTSATLETYIVHVELPQSSAPQLASTNPVSNDDLDSWYRSFLPPTKKSPNSINDTTEEEPHIVYSYHNVFKGFAARLSPEDVKAMEKKPGFISAKPQKMLPLHTTHSPNFLGLNQNMGFWNESNYGKGIIIGVLDTGILPDHPSFGDAGMPPPPAKWKGQCQFSNFTCNKKLIGARSFVNDSTGPPIDANGHGTHTASTAAGNFVPGANVFGNANGTAVGIAPLAHLAIYKVCADRCADSAILAAIDVAIDDGVDILSLSLGGGSEPFYSDATAIGAYSAMEKGIFVSCSAGNDGPKFLTLSNEAPWILTVGASTVDRKFRSTVVLGNSEQLIGEAFYQPTNFPPTQYPLYFPSESPYCTSTLISIAEVKGSIVLCQIGEISAADKGLNVRAAGGVGMIVFNTEAYGYSTQPEAQVFPATHITYADALKVSEYLQSASSPTAAITFQGTIIGDDLAPEIAAFSSRGPNQASPRILKPDIIGPGVNILAAWPQSVENNPNTKSTFNAISGTSMSCPHLSGVAALLKSAHPDWSPAAIKSAIMTTADNVNLAKNPIVDQTRLPANVYALGSGHVNPSRANNPGLIYDNEPKDYIPYLCGLGYTNAQVGIILGRTVDCLQESSIAESQLNYPSFSVLFGSDVQKYTRTVTNVGEANSVYTVKLIPPGAVNVTVSPSTLSFSTVNQKLTYEVTFSKSAAVASNSFSQGSLSWISSNYTVGSPIAVLFQ